MSGVKFTQWPLKKKYCRDVLKESLRLESRIQACIFSFHQKFTLNELSGKHLKAAISADSYFKNYNYLCDYTRKLKMKILKMPS